MSEKFNVENADRSNDDAYPSLYFNRTQSAGGPLAKKQLTKLKIYSGNDHPHSAQNPKMIELDKLNNKNIIRN